MKNIIISFCSIFLLTVLINAEPVYSQENTEFVNVSIIKTENGQVVNFDSSFTCQPGFDVEAFIQSLDILNLPEDDHGEGKKIRRIEKRIIKCDSSLAGNISEPIIINGDSITVGISLGSDEEIKLMECKPGENVQKKVIIIDKTGDDNSVTNEVSCKVMVVKVRMEDPADEEKSSVTGNNKTIKNIEEIDDLKFFPNPGDGKFEISFNVKSRDDLSIKVKDSSGKQIYNEELKNFEGEFKKQIDISDKNKGIYFLSVQHGKKEMVKKLIIQ